MRCQNSPTEGGNYLDSQYSLFLTRGVGNADASLAFLPDLAIDTVFFAKP